MEINGWTVSEKKEGWELSTPSFIEKDGWQLSKTPQLPKPVTVPTDISAGIGLGIPKIPKRLTPAETEPIKQAFQITRDIAQGLTGRVLTPTGLKYMDALLSQGFAEVTYPIAKPLFPEAKEKLQRGREYLKLIGKQAEKEDVNLFTPVQVAAALYLFIKTGQDIKHLLPDIKIGTQLLLKRNPKIVQQLWNTLTPEEKNLRIPELGQYLTHEQRIEGLKLRQTAQQQAYQTLLKRPELPTPAVTPTPPVTPAPIAPAVAPTPVTAPPIAPVVPPDPTISAKPPEIAIKPPVPVPEVKEAWEMTRDEFKKELTHAPGHILFERFMPKKLRPAFMDNDTGKVYITEPLHDIEKLPPDIKKKFYERPTEIVFEDGFVDETGVFLTREEAKSISLGTGSIKYQNKTPEYIHKDLVKIAISEGKPVPAEVLKDYPELAKAVKPIPKELEPLVKEAKKYKSVDMWIKERYPEIKADNQIYETVAKIRKKYPDAIEFLDKDIDRMTARLLEKYPDEVPEDLKKVLYTLTVKDLETGEILSAAEVGLHGGHIWKLRQIVDNLPTKSELTDIWKQAQTIPAIVPEVKPEVPEVKPIVTKPQEAVIFPTGKENVLNQIKEAIKEAPGTLREVLLDVYRRPSAELKKDEALQEKEGLGEFWIKEATGKEPATVDFKIDGGFKIENTKQALWSFYKRVKATPEKIAVGVKPFKEPTLPKPTPAGKERLLKEFQEELDTYDSRIEFIKSELNRLKKGEITDDDIIEADLIDTRGKEDWEISEKIANLIGSEPTKTRQRVIEKLVPKLEQELTNISISQKLAKQNIAELQKLIEKNKPLLKRHPEEALDKTNTEPEFLEKGADIGLAVKKVIPESINITIEQTEIPITIEREPPDLVGLSGFIKSWIAPVRFIAGNNPIAQKIAHLGRDTLTLMGNEQKMYSERIERAVKGLNQKEKQNIAILLDKIPTEQELTILSEKGKIAYQELRTITTEIKSLVSEFKMADIEKWTIPDNAYYPHIFVGQYQILDGKKTIPDGFKKTLGEALDKTKEYLQTNPTANITIKPKDIGGEYTATMLSRKGFFRFIQAVSEATTLNREEVMGLMKGVSAIKPRPKFVGNFERRIANLEGFIDDPELAFKIYTSRIIRKKWLDPFRKKATNWATELPPGLRQYFLDYIDDVSGKYDPFNKNFIISKAVGKLTKAQSALKLGYRPSTAFVNRLQPFHTAYSEIGNYIFLGEKFKFTKQGQKIIELSGIKAQAPKYYALEFLAPTETPLWKPLGAFSIAEKANREQVIAGGYLYAKKVFSMPQDRVIKQGKQYILDYLDYYSYRDNYLPYQVKLYSQIGLPPSGRVPLEIAKEISAIEYAKDLNVDSNYIYDTSDLPKLLRKTLARPVFQFKNYTINFLFQSSKWIKEAMIHPTPHNVARASRLIASNIAVGGLKTPIRIAQWFMPRNIMKKILFVLLLGVVAEKNERVRKVYRTIYQGVFSTIGIDLSERIAPDIYIPRKPVDLFGATASDISKIVKGIERGDKPLKIILQPFILGKDIYEYFEIPKSQITGYRQRQMIEANEWERFLDVVGFTPSKLGIVRDVTALAKMDLELYKSRKSVYIDKIIEADENKDYEEINNLRNKAKEEGIEITGESIIREKLQKKSNEQERRLKILPKAKREEYLPLLKSK